MHLLFFVLFLFACGGAGAGGGAPDAGDAGPDAAPLGQTGLALSVPSGYGFKSSDLSRCTSPALIGCLFPADKQARYRFHAGSCSSWWQAQVVAAWNDWLIVDRDLGWNILPPTSSGAADVNVHCVSDTGPGLLGGFTPQQFDDDGDGVWSYHKGHINLYVNRVAARPDWAGKTDVQRQRFARNVVGHELFHSSGLSHNDASPLMKGGDPGSVWYTNLFYPTGTELSAIENFVP